MSVIDASAGRTTVAGTYPMVGLYCRLLPIRLTVRGERFVDDPITDGLAPAGSPADGCSTVIMTRSAVVPAGSGSAVERWARGGDRDFGERAMSRKVTGAGDRRFAARRAADIRSHRRLDKGLSP